MIWVNMHHNKCIPEFYAPADLQAVTMNVYCMALQMKVFVAFSLAWGAFLEYQTRFQWPLSKSGFDPASYSLKLSTASGDGILPSRHTLTQRGRHKMAVVWQMRVLDSFPYILYIYIFIEREGLVSNNTKIHYIWIRKWPPTPHLPRNRMIVRPWTYFLFTMRTWWDTGPAVVCWGILRYICILYP